LGGVVSGAHQHRLLLVEAAQVKVTSALGLLLINLVLISFVTVGGLFSVIPELHRIIVEKHGWLSEQQFVDLFAIAQAAPGPNMLFVTLVGWQMAGWTGALLATLATVGPTCVLTYFMTRVWDRFKDAPLRVAIQTGLIPVTIGLIGATAYLIAKAVDISWVAVALTGATAAFAYFTRFNPLWALMIAAAVGFSGLV
jgi:chromate transporter